MLSTRDEKKAYFNNYWQTRDIVSADARSVERSSLVAKLIGDDKTLHLVDAGCGRGVIMTRLAEAGYKISGCDMSSDTISFLCDNGFDAYLCDLENDPLPRPYDGILCLEVLQQVFDPGAVLDKFKSSLTKNGFMIISVPNEYHLLSRIRLLLGRSHLGHFEESHIRLFTPVRGRELFEKIGLTVEETINVSVIPPRFKVAGIFGRLLANILPGLFSISQIYRLKIK